MTARLKTSRGTARRAPRLWDEVTDPLHHLEHGAAQGAANPKSQTNFVAALSQMARRHSEPFIGSPCHRCPAFASFPPVRPRASGRARVRASPGIRVSHAGFHRRHFEQAALRKTKNPPERWLGRVRVKRIVDIALGEIAPMSRACTIDRPIAVQQLAEVFKTALHCSTHVVPASGTPAERAVFTSARSQCQARLCFRILSTAGRSNRVLLSDDRVRLRGGAVLRGWSVRARVRRDRESSRCCR